MHNGRPAGLQLGSAQRIQFLGRQPACRPGRALGRGLTVQTHAALDPHKVLGVAPGASDKEIKRAHRKLVLQHHPDLAQGVEGVEVKFLAIQEAYEILLGRRVGKETGVGPASSSWDFHDWFWKFSMRRRRGADAGAASPPPPEAARQQWRAQMAGLRQKAAAKRQRGAGRGAAHAARAANPTEASASSVWRSTTKNARKAPQAPATAAAQQAAAPAPQQREVLSQAAAASAAALQQHQEQRRRRQAPSEAEQPLESAAAAAAGAAAAQPSPGAGAHDAPEPAGAWRSMVTRAVHAVHDLGHRHRSHAARLQSHIASVGEKLSLRLQLQAFRELVPEAAAGAAADAHGPLRSPLRWRGLHAWNFAGVPSEQELHLLFEEAVRGVHAAEPAAAAAGADAGAYPRPDRHARTFADREHVKTRLSTQLTGLKRRAAMKREFDDY